MPGTGSTCCGFNNCPQFFLTLPTIINSSYLQCRLALA